jgi:amidase
MRGWIVGSASVSAITIASAAWAQALGPAQTNVRSALARISQVDPELHSVIAVDPTAMSQARAVDGGNLRGPLAGQPVLI